MLSRVQLICWWIQFTSIDFWILLINITLYLQKNLNTFLKNKRFLEFLRLRCQEISENIQLLLQSWKSEKFFVCLVTNNVALAFFFIDWRSAWFWLIFQFPFD